MELHSSGCSTCPQPNPFKIASKMCDLCSTAKIPTWEWIILLAEIVVYVVVLGEMYKMYSSWQTERKRAAESLSIRMNAVLQEATHECPICMGETCEFPILTLCGHVFCCDCIFNFWHRMHPLGDISNCPYCTCTFQMMLPIRWPTNAEREEEINANFQRVDAYNKTFNIRPTLIDHIDSFCDHIFQRYDGPGIVLQRIFIASFRPFAVIFFSIIGVSLIVPEVAVLLQGDTLLIFDDFFLLFMYFIYFLSRAYRTRVDRPNGARNRQ